MEIVKMKFNRGVLKGLVKAKNSQVGKQVLLFCGAAVLAVGKGHAADAAGTGGFEFATTTIAGYAPFVKKLLYAIAAVVALVGAFSIYFKMQNGDQDVKKSIMLTIGGCVALIAMATALPQFFGITVN